MGGSPAALKFTGWVAFIGTEGSTLAFVALLAPIDPARKTAIIQVKTREV